MRAPATAALLLAALSALPCRGTDADASLLRNVPRHPTESKPTLNKLYQMLHTGKLNTTELYDFDYTTVQGFNLNDNLVTSSDNRVLESMDTAQVKDSRSRMKRVVSVMRSDTESSTVAMTSPPVMMERKKKPGESGSSAPLLNYIFDTYSNTHQHRNEKAGTNSGIYAAAAPEIEALVGSTAHLDCKVDALHDKLVSWVRRKNEDDPMELLYTGTQQYTADDRYSSRFIPPDIWRLEVKEVRPSDAAHYDCQMPTHPPRTARLTLRVPEVSVRIVDGAGAAVNEQVCELGSTVALRCEVRGLRMEGGPSLLWYRKEDLLNDDTTRGGISVRTEFGPNGANSVLRVARVRSDDAGRYACTVARAPPPSPPPAHVILHVIKGESLAELHQGGCPSKSTHALTLTLSVVLHAYLILYYNDIDL